MIDETQRKLRRHYIGASDAPAICGVDPWKTAMDVWADKTGQTTDASAPSAAMQIGNYFEGGVLDWLEDELDAVIVRDQFFAAKNDVQATNTDGLVIDHPDGPALVEVKVCGLLGPSEWAKAWGDPEAGVEAVPENVVVQTHAALAVLDDHHPGIRRAIVGAFIGGRGFCKYEIRRDDDLVEAIRRRVLDFHAQHVVTRIAPPGSALSADIAKRLIRTKGKAIDVEPGLVAAFLSARDARKTWEDVEEEAKLRLLAALGDAEVGQCELGQVAYLEQSRKAYTVAPTTFRKLSFKPANKLIGATRNRIEALASGK